MTATRHSRQEKLQYSGREEDFPAFLEQFEARVYTLGLSDTLLDKVNTTSVKDVETQQETDDRVKEETDLQKWRYMVWCELCSASTKPAPTSFVATSRTGQQPGQPSPNFTSLQSGLEFSH